MKCYLRIMQLLCVVVMTKALRMLVLYRCTITPQNKEPAIEILRVGEKREIKSAGHVISLVRQRTSLDVSKRRDGREGPLSSFLLLE